MSVIVGMVCIPDVYVYHSTRVDQFLRCYMHSYV